MFNLTQQERQVTLFLITLALIGLGINFLMKRCSAVRTIVCLDQNIGKIDLNTADKQMLIEIPGIGKKIAQRIVEYRSQQGIFRDTEELKKIKGITDYRYQKLKESLFVK
jgi:competence ComEA-like helix-hairpin-helix protein